MNPDVNRSHRRGIRSWKLTIAWGLSIAALFAPSAAYSQSYTFTHFVGNPGGVGYEDGVAGTARFHGPRGIAADSAGTLYVADTDNFTIRKITPAGVVSTLAGLAGKYGNTDGRRSAAQFSGAFAITVDATGNAYVIDGNLVRKLTPAGLVTTLAGNPYGPGSTDGTGSEASFYYPSGIAIDGAGNLYVADRFNHTIRKVTPAGVVTTLAGLAGVPGSDDGTSQARFASPASVATDNAGNVYVGDSGNYTIRKITPGGSVSTLAGTAGAYGYVDDVGPLARFVYPSSLTTDASGNVYVGDGSYVRRITAGGSVTTVASAVGSVAGLARDGAGNLYTADSFTHTIRKITPAGAVSTFAGLPETYGAANGTGSAATFSYPSDIAKDTSGNLYVTETNNHDVRKITPAGAVSVLADGSFGSQFTFPDGLCTDSAGNVYVADTSDHIILKVTPSGVVTTVAGSKNEPGSADGTSAARFNYPYDIARDSAGNLYVADRGNSTVRKITPGGVVSTLAGLAGVPGTANGTTQARFANLKGIVIDNSDNIYVADGETIRKITLAGVVSALAGEPDVQGTADGAGNTARFIFPEGLATDSSGNIYVADARTIRRVTPAGVVTTLGGNPEFGNRGTSDGTGPEARFMHPSGIEIDVTGTIYVTDLTGNSVRIGKPAISDIATIDANAGFVGVARQLDVTPQTATSWQWSIIRRPAGSTASLSSTSIRNPTFTPDVGDLYQFRLIATSASGSSITVVSLTAGSAPVLTPSSPLSRTGGSSATSSVVATVSDGEDEPGTLVVFDTFVPAGLTISDIQNVNGTITATVSAACGMAPGSYEIVLRVQDSSGNTTPGGVTVNVTANSAPVLGTYGNATVDQGQSMLVTPSAAPSDNNGFTLAAQVSGAFIGGVFVDSVTGGVYINNPGPGTFTVTVTATDDCGSQSTASFTLTVNTVTCPPTPLACPGSVNGTLTTSSCPNSARGPGYYAGVYTFSGSAGSAVTIDLTADYDTYLYLLAPDGSIAIQDDDGGTGLNSRIQYALTTSGTWTIHVTTFGGSVTGPYQLAIEGCPAPPANTVENGGFEQNGGAGSRSLSGWTPFDLQFEPTAGSWFAQSGTSSLYGPAMPAPPQGTFAAVESQTGQGTRILYQNINLPLADVWLSFRVALNNEAAAWYSRDSLNPVGGQSQQFRVDLMDPTHSPMALETTSELNVFKTSPGDPLVSPYTLVRFHVPAVLRGQPVRLRFAEVNNVGPLTVGIDDVRLNRAPVVTPAATVSRTAGQAATTSSVATVSDAEDGAGTLTATALAVSEGLIVTLNPPDSQGNVTAMIRAECNATAGNKTFTIRTEDTEGATATATYTVNVIANPAPALGNYANVSMLAGASTTVIPSVPASDNGTWTVSAAKPAAFTGTVTPDPSKDGRIAIANPNGGVWTITVTVTDDCGKTTSSQFQLTVSTNFQSAPQGFSATAISTTQALLQWAPVAGTDIVYMIERSTRPRSSYSVIPTQNRIYTDTGLTPNTAYVYRVYATSASLVGARSPNSAPDIATTIAFTEPLNAGMTATAAHILQIRTAVNLIRQAADLGPTPFTDEGLPAGTAIKAVHVNELRAAVVAARGAFASIPGPDNPGTFAPLAFTDTIAAGTFIKAVHLRELRDAVR